MDINGQGNSLTFFHGHPNATFSNFFSLETAKPSEAKFHMEPPWDEGMKASTNALCHMAAMPIYELTSYLVPFVFELEKICKKLLKTLRWKLVYIPGS